MGLIKVEVQSGANVWINPSQVVQIRQSLDLVDCGFSELILSDDSHYMVKGTPEELAKRMVKRDETIVSSSDSKSGVIETPKVSGKFRKRN